MWKTSLTKQWGASAATEAGASVRRISEGGYLQRLSTPPELLDSYRGPAHIWSGYVQQSWSISSRFRFEAGARAESDSLSPVHTASPYASFSAGVWSGGRITASIAQAAQFPEVSQLTSIAGGTSLLPERSSQAQIALQQTFGESTRIRLDVYDRQDRDLLFRPMLDPRILDGRIFGGDPLAPWENSQRAHARGVEVFVQRRSANRLSGWISYSYNFTRFRDGNLNLAFPSDFDAGSSVRIFGTYRLTNTWNLS